MATTTVSCARQIADATAALQAAVPGSPQWALANGQWTDVQRRCGVTTTGVNMPPTTRPTIPTTTMAPPTTRPTIPTTMPTIPTTKGQETTTIACSTEYNTIMSSINQLKDGLISLQGSLNTLVPIVNTLPPSITQFGIGCANIKAIKPLLGGKRSKKHHTKKRSKRT